MTCSCQSRDWKLKVVYKSGDSVDLAAPESLTLPEVFVDNTFAYKCADGFQVVMDLNDVRELRHFYTTR